MQPEMLFPVSLNLKGKSCLVLGGGPIALAKLRPLLDTGARIHVVASRAAREIGQLARCDRLELIAAPLAPSHCEGIFLAIDSGENPACSTLLRREAATRNIILNTVDKPESCDYFTPAVVRRGPVQIAISTGGAAPALARYIRQMLDRLLPQGLGDLVIRAGAFRPRVQAALSSTHQRSFWNRLFAPESLTRLSALNAADTDLAMERLIRDAAENTVPAGKVTLVGAGAGGADMITLKGLRALESADVVLHDALIDRALLNHARRDAELMAVGKRCGRHSSTQEFINRTLASFARQGKQVVRLKCGDPFIFGRGGEEVQHLEEQGITVEVIAGVTAAAVAAAELALPLTHRGVARRITFMTASTNEALDADRPDWKALLSGGTVGLYMPRRSLSACLEAIRNAGHKATMPAVLVANAGRPEARVVHATIGTLANALEGTEDHIPNAAPALVLIGDAMQARMSQLAPHHPIHALPALRFLSETDTVLN